MLLHDMGIELESSTGYYGSIIPAADRAPTTSSPRPSSRRRRVADRAALGRGRLGPYLHDGRAETLEEAIELHGGEASRRRRPVQGRPRRRPPGDRRVPEDDACPAPDRRRPGDVVRGEVASGVHWLATSIDAGTRCPGWHTGFLRLFGVRGLEGVDDVPIMVCDCGKRLLRRRGARGVARPVGACSACPSGAGRDGEGAGVQVAEASERLRVPGRNRRSLRHRPAAAEEAERAPSSRPRQRSGTASSPRRNGPRRGSARACCTRSGGRRGSRRWWSCRRFCGSRRSCSSRG